MGWSVPGNPNLNMGRKKQKDGPLGTGILLEWYSWQHLPLRAESYLLKLAPVRPLLRAEDHNFWWLNLLGPKRVTVLDSHVVWKHTGWGKKGFLSTQSF